MNSPQSAYLESSVATASPARLLVMLCDRMVLDLTRGLEAQKTGDTAAAHRELLHAQEIVLELRTSLDMDAWSGAPALANLYGWMLTELIGANIAKDADRVAACRALVEPQRDAWREAAAAAVAG